MMQEEYKIQRDAIRLIDQKWPNLLYCASAGGMRTSMGTAVKMKAAGYRKGFPDLMIYEPRGKWHGLAIEFKTAKGRLSPEQIEWGESLTERGYFWYVCRSIDDAEAVISFYLSANLDT
jgi:hypothetical protein